MIPDIIENYEGVLNNGSCNNSNQETLALFPLHPTGVSEGKATLMSSLGSTTSGGNSTILPLALVRLLLILTKKALVNDNTSLISSLAKVLVKVIKNMV